MRRKKISKLISIVMFVLMVLFCLPVSAASVGSTASDPSLGQDVVQSAQTEYSEVSNDRASTDAFLTVDDSDVVVSVPTTVILSGSSDDDGRYIGEYTVGVSGNISGDKQIVVEPKSYSVDMIQSGKIDKTATITQTQTLFSSEDLSNNVTAKGSISAVGLTAGSWNGTCVFVISMTSKMQYYSSVELAAGDANAMTYDNADCKTAEDENAIAALYVDKENNTSSIRLLKNANNVQNFTLDNDTVLDLDGHTLSFGSGKGMIYNKNLSVVDGKIQSSDNTYTIQSTKTTNSLNVSDVVFDANISANIKASHYEINSSSKNIALKNCTFNASGTGNKSYSVIGLSVINETGLIDISGCDVLYHVDNSKNLKFAQMFGSQKIEDFKADMYSDASGGVYGFQIMVSGKDTILKNTELNNVNITTTSETTASDCIYVGGEYNVTASGLTLYGDCLKNRYGTGIFFGENTNATIISTEESPVNVYGKQWGIQTAPKGQTVIDGGTYTSTNHIGYIEGNADIYNAEFYTANRDKYESQYLDSVFGFYCGSSSQVEGCTVNLHNCTIGKPDARSGITAKRNGGYIAPENINIYDCDIYGNLSYNYTFANNLGNTKFNLYGDTRIWKNANTEWSKEEVAFAINNWKTSILYSSDTQKYNAQYLGKYMINGYVANIDIDTGEILDVYLTDDANVYDYR